MGNPKQFKMVGRQFAKWLPLILIQAFLWITFFLFWTTNHSRDIHNPWVLSGFVFSSYAGLLVGYVVFVHSRRGRLLLRATNRQTKGRSLLIFFAAIHLLTYGIATLAEYNCLSVSSIRDALANPGAAYAAKFGVYQDQIDSNRVSLPIQLVVTNFWIYYVGLICIVYWWSDIRRSVRVLFLTSVLVYLLAFACIGTQKALADVLLLTSVGLLLRYSSLLLANSRREAAVYRMPHWAHAGVALVLFFGYISINQLSRAEQFGISERISDDATNSLWGNLLPPKAAVLANNIANYSSQGYAGLAHSLTQSPGFSYGFGLAPAAHSYAQQYFGASDCYELTYLARSERETGWPGRMYWSTAFPWWASDVTFPGVVLLMVLIGSLLARAWLSALQSGRLAAIVSLGLLFEMLFFITANNQVFASRTGLWAVMAVIALHFIGVPHHPNKKSPHVKNEPHTVPSHGPYPESGAT